MVDGVAESILKSVDSEPLERVSSRSAEIKTSGLPVEKKQEPFKSQKQPKPRQSKRVKKRDRGDGIVKEVRFRSGLFMRLRWQSLDSAFG